MWVLRKYRPSYAHLIVLLALLVIGLYALFNDRSPPLNSIRALPQNLSSATVPTVEYIRIQLSSTSDDKICRPDDYLLIYILSTASNIQRRKVIRSTWGSKQNKTCLVFILGQVSGRTKNAGMLQMTINNEKDQFNDIVQIDHIESYANVVYKEVAALVWAQKFYPGIPYLFKTDDDLIVDILLLSDLAQLLVVNTSQTNSYFARHRPSIISSMMSADRDTFFRGGWSMNYQPTLRGGGKFSISTDVWPHAVLPLYCSGFGWMMSKHVRDRIILASYTYPLKKVPWIGDVFLSGFLAKVANVKCTGLAIDLEQTGSANCSCSMVMNPMLTVCSSTFHAGGGSSIEAEKYVEYQRAWQIIQLRHNFTEKLLDHC